MASVMFFWITEDWLWFLINPAFGLGRFNPTDVPWHKHWLGPVPIDYWIFSSVAVILLWIAERKGLKSYDDACLTQAIAK